MTPGLPPNIFKSGQDFQTQRRKNAARGVESARYEDGCCGGPKPADVWKGRKGAIEGDIKRQPVKQQPSFQRRYGEDRREIPPTPRK